MMKYARNLALLCMASILALSLAACASSGNASGSAQQGDTERVERTMTREDVEGILHKAAETTFTNVAFTNKTETSATGAATNGQMQTQTIRTTMKGQLDRSGDKPQLHMSYEAQSNIELGKTSYEMFINSDNLIVRQGEQLYVDAMTDETLNSYAASITSILSTEEIDSMLDMASGFKMEEYDDETTITITVDTDQLVESEEVDESALPESTQIATMVVSYTIDSTDHINTVRLMSSTTGTPTYRVTQTYEFEDYDETTLPEWPDLAAYVAQQSGIMTDESGRMYIVGDDGVTYYVSEIGDDGTIYYDTSGSGTSYSDQTYYYYDDTGSDSGSTDTSTGDTSSSDDSNQGRAYITAYDGTIHYLDEPGSEIRDLGGATVFIDANGEWYFLDYGDEEG